METHTAAQFQRTAHFDLSAETAKKSRIPRGDVLVTRIPLPRLTIPHEAVMKSWHAASPPMTTFVDEGRGYYNQGASPVRS